MQNRENYFCGLPLDKISTGGLAAPALRRLRFAQKGRGIPPFAREKAKDGAPTFVPEEDERRIEADSSLPTPELEKTLGAPFTQNDIS